MTDISTVTPGTDRWRQLVREAVAKDANRNWFLGDAALEIAPMGDDHAHNGAYENLRRFAEEIGVDYEPLRQYRHVASAWPEGTRVPSASWKAHQILRSPDKRHLLTPGMTTTEASKAAGYRSVGRTGPESPVEDRVKQTAANLADPDVVRNLPAEDKAKLAAELLDDEDVADAPEVRQASRQATTRRLKRDEDDMRARGGNPDYVEPFPGDLVAEASRIRGHLDGVRRDIDRLMARAESDQRQKLVDMIRPKAEQVLEHLDAGLASVPDFVPDDL